MLFQTNIPTYIFKDLDYQSKPLLSQMHYFSSIDVVWGARSTRFEQLTDSSCCTRYTTCQRDRKLLTHQLAVGVKTRGYQLITSAHKLPKPQQCSNQMHSYNDLIKNISRLPLGRKQINIWHKQKSGARDRYYHTPSCVGHLASVSLPPVINVPATLSSINSS